MHFDFFFFQEIALWLKSAAFGIVIGGFLPLLAVPFLEKYVTKSKYHTVVGDHEDLKKDLKKKHR